MKNLFASSEVISAVITVFGSVITFLLASLFSLHSRKIDERHYFARELLNRRLSYYEDLIHWLPVERILESIDNMASMNLDSFADIFTHHFSEFTDFIVRARLYGSNEIFRELVAFKKEYKVRLEKALADKKIYKSSVNIPEGGEDIFNSLLDLSQRYVARITAIISKELALDDIRADFRQAK